VNRKFLFPSSGNLGHDVAAADELQPSLFIRHQEGVRSNNDVDSAATALPRSAHTSRCAIMQSVFSAASRRTNSHGEKKGPGHDGALKTDWTKPWHGAASYGDRMAPVMVSRALERVEAGGSAARTAIMECAPGWRCAAAGARRVREALAVDCAARSSGGLVAASGPSKALGRQWVS
jgi:hypothetical protein